jgi:hypothetical protein
MIKPYIAAWTDLGFDIVLDNNYFGNDLTVFVECFSQHHVEKIERVPNFGIIATECLVHNGFNNDMSFNDRYNNFLRIRPRSKFLIVNSVGLGDYEQLMPAVPTCVVEIGWHPSLDLPNNDTLAVNDFCFYGTSSGLRVDILRELRSLGFSVASIFGTMSYNDRNAMIQSSKWVLGLKPRWTVEFMSATRITSAVFCGRPVAHEKVVINGIVGEVPLIHNGDDNLIQWLVNIKEQWKEERDRQVAKFRCTSITDNMRNGMTKFGIVSTK